MNMTKVMRHSTFGKVFKIVLLAGVSLWAVLTISLHFIVNSQAFKDKVVQLAEKYIDADLSIGSIEASVFKKFPNLNLSIDSLDLTYPHDRFGAYDKVGFPHSLRNRGRGLDADTLAHFNHFSISLDYLSLLRGRIRLPETKLDGVKLYAKQFDSITSNWDILKMESSQNSTKSKLPNVVINRLELSGNPHISFAAPTDTLYASIDMGEAGFEGRVNINSIWSSKVHFNLDSLDVSARLPHDTVALQLHNFSINEKNDIYNFKAVADAYLMSSDLGRFEIPADFSGNVTFPQKDFKAISLRDLTAGIGTLDIVGEGDLVMEADSSYVRGELSIYDCPVQETLHSYAAGILPEVRNLHTDARIDLTLLADGWYVPSKQALPQLIAEIVIPETELSYEGFEYSGKIVADIEAVTDKYGNLEIDVQQFIGKLAGVTIDVKGFAEDVLSSDPLIALDLKANASLDTLNGMLPEGMSAEGELTAEVNGYILASDIDLYNFSRADLEGYIKSDRISFRDETRDLFAHLDSTNILLGKDGMDSLLGADLLGFKGQVDSVFVSMGKNTLFRGRKLNMTAQNASDAVNANYGKEIHPIVGTIAAEHFAMTGADSLSLNLEGTANNFKYSNLDDEGAQRPMLSFTSRNKDISFKKGVSRIGLNNLSISASAIKRAAGRRPGRNRRNYLDSLQNIYPGVPRDSLIDRVVRRSRISATAVPDFLLSEDFKKNDIDFRFDESISKYMREWAFDGSLQIDSGLLLTPHFPLRNNIENVKGGLTNKRITLDNLSLYSGESDLSMNGKISNLDRAVLRNGVLDLELNVVSQKININELLNAYNTGQQFTGGQRHDEMNESMTDEEYLSEIIATESPVSDSTQSLIVIPANVNIKISLEGNEIDYSQLKVDWFESDIVMKERTLQVTNTVATSNMGDIYLECFYTTRTKQDISAGFDLNLASITADKVVTLFPAVDSIMPVIKSFKGNLDCEIAATSQIDTNMNFILPSINGILNIKGSDLSLEGNKAMDKLARVLMFRERKMGKIEDMSAQGIISNSRIEVFPFVMKVDRYTLAMNGFQNFDQSFNYHVSVLKSPIPFRFGINLKGNFDDWNYKIGKAKYKNVNVPVFTAELQNMQMNLVNSIHNIFTKGVELVMRQQEGSLQYMDRTKSEAGYDDKADSEDLEAEEMDELNRLIEESEENEQVQELP